jgi:predicted CXXCH cytochrome family protein
MTTTPAARALNIHAFKEVMTVRKLALLGAIGALWLFVAALPVLADGGPHTMATNNGSLGLTADSCAGCHRAHTATAASLLNTEQPELCLNCHDGSKATTDVIDGVQYSATSKTLPVLGALRGGGFQYALINSSNAARASYQSDHGSGPVTAFIGHVQPLALQQKVTSTHGGTGGIYNSGWGDGTVWGNGDVSSQVKTVGAFVTLECGSCHNPHGNGQYRILQTTPSLTATVGTFTVTNTGGVKVTDTTTTGTHNYTIKPASDAADANGSAANIVGTASGDYWRYHWDPTGSALWYTLTNPPKADPMNSGWNGVTEPTNSTGAMTAWCIQCHTRYNGYAVDANGVITTAQGSHPSSLVAQQPEDAVFMYKHGTTRIGCEQCHVSHGSNAVMAAADSSFSLNYLDPSGTKPPTVANVGLAGNTPTSGDSRLLKVDNRGTCQMCHDPTGTMALPAPATLGTFVGPNNGTDAGGGIYVGPFGTAPYVPGN